MNRKSANTCLTDMINISIESFKLLLNEINQIENKNSFIIIREEALLSKGASNEEMVSQDLILYLCDTDTENTSLILIFLIFLILIFISMGGAREGLAGAPAPPRKTKAPP